MVVDLVLAPKVPSVGSRGRKPVVGWPPYQLPLLRRALAVGAKAEIGALPRHCWDFFAACRHFLWPLPLRPLSIAFFIRDLEGYWRGGYVGIADWEASARVPRSGVSP